MPENLERWERLNREKEGEINSFMIKVPAEKIRVVETTTLGVVAFGVDANLSKKDDVKGRAEGNDLVDDVNFLEIGGYLAKESVKDVAIGDNHSLMQSTGIT